ncbi:MAG: D,D-dipeptide ABC transporter permease, partial [Thermomicrobiaceae bacterium]|nr:D,D-dipeptide ABC transporter permease [Thermomicrobiaceae bacterium]
MTAPSTPETIQAREVALRGRLSRPETRGERARKALHRFFAGRWLNVVGVAIILLFLFLSLFGRALAPYDPIKPQIKDKFQAPSTEHVFGTDDLGRDILSRVMTGARISLGVA